MRTKGLVRSSSRRERMSERVDDGQRGAAQWLEPAGESQTRGITCQIERVRSERLFFRSM